MRSRDEARENTEDRNGRGCGDVSTGGVVADIEAAPGDVGGEAGEGTVPEVGRDTGLGDCPLDTFCLFATSTSVDQDWQGQILQDLGLEWVGNALSGVLAYAEADRSGVGLGGQASGEVGSGVRGYRAWRRARIA